MNKTAVAIFAHPDDAEIECSGTLSLLKKAGWQIHIATMANGDKGTAEYKREEIARIRKAEASEAAKVLDATYTCIGFPDIYIMYNKEAIDRTTALLRKLQPSIVFTHNPSDYMVDHETTSRIVMTACFCTGMMNLEIDETPYEPVPYLYYADSMEAKDILGRPILTTMFVDVTTEIEVKAEMLIRHASQRNWLLVHHKMDEYILSMKRFGELRGKSINVPYAEGFRQHLGHGYPQDNILKEIIPGKVVLANEKAATLI